MYFVRLPKGKFLMADTKPKPKPKPKPKEKTKAKTTKAKAKVKPKPELTKAEEFYIDNNLNKTDVELAADLGKSLPCVRQHIHKTQGDGRINKLLIREKGCVI